MHLNIVKGDFTFCQWKDDFEEELSKKEKELTDSGYVMVDEEFDFQNIYTYYRNNDGDEQVVTILCM